MKIPFVVALAFLFLGTVGLKAESAHLAIGEFYLQGGKVVAPDCAAVSGQNVTLEIPVSAPLGSKIGFQPEMLQLSGNLAVPVALPADFKTPILDFSAVTHRVAALSLTAPEVKRPTRFLFRVSLVIGAKKNDALISSIRLLVFPKEKTGELSKTIAQKQKESGLSLSVFGESPAIRNFLQARGVDFSDEGAEWPVELKADVLYVGQATAKKIAENLRTPIRSRMLVFLSDSDVLPGVYRTETTAGIVTKVSLSLLDSLEINPRSQQLFTELLFQNLTRSTETP